MMRVCVFPEQFGWNDVSMHGSHQIPTPTIDSLASEGVLLDNYMVNPVCSPTRASLLSGRSVVHTGVFVPYGNGMFASGLNTSYSLLPQQLKPMGYHSYMLGKWHLGMKSKQFLPSSRGFEKYMGYLSGVMDYWTHSLDEGGINGLDFHYGGTGFGLQPGEEKPLYNTSGIYSTDLLASTAAEWIEDHSKDLPDDPMFMYLPFQGCHSADNRLVQATPAKLSKFASISPNETCGQYMEPQTDTCTKVAMRKTIAGCVSSIDDGIATVVNALKEANMYDDTLLVVSTDVNGGPTDGADSNMMNNFPLRGCKGGYFDGGLRGVGLITGPLAKKGYVSHALHHVTDWFPSLVTAASRGLPDMHGNVPFPDAQFDATRVGDLPFLPGDGVDNWDAINTGAPSARTELLHVMQAEGSTLQSHALRQGDMKLLWHPAGTDCSVEHAGWYPPPGLAWNYTTFSVDCGGPPPDNSQAALLKECTKEAPCLFNTSSDPCEYHNLASSMPAMVEKLKARFDYYRPNVVLPWTNYKRYDPRSSPTNFGANVTIQQHGPSFPNEPTRYSGVFSPWMTDAEADTYYPVKYVGPGYPPKN